MHWNLRHWFSLHQSTACKCFVKVKHLVFQIKNTGKISPSWHTVQKQTRQAPSEVRFQSWLGPNVNQLKQMVWRAGQRGWPRSAETRGREGNVRHYVYLFACESVNTDVNVTRTLLPRREGKKKNHVRPVCFAGAWGLCGKPSSCHCDRRTSEEDKHLKEGFGYLMRSIEFAASLFSLHFIPIFGGWTNIPLQEKKTLF